MSNVYSFLNVNATFAGAGGIVNLAAGAAVAEEGIMIDAAEDKNVMTIGADGKGQHSLIASDAGNVTVKLLKTSPINQALMNIYNLQSTATSLWGQNIITIVDSARGDTHILEGVAFKKKPSIGYAKEAGFNEWTFDAIKVTSILGV